MTCTNPPRLGDKELLAYVDGEADHRVISHVEQCSYCSERAECLAHWQTHLTAQLYRHTCPSSLELGEYHLGLLAQDRAMAISQHLDECLHCTSEVTQLRDYLGALAPSLETGLLERAKGQVRVLIARLVSGGEGRSLLAGPALAPAYAGVRGEEAGPYLYEAEDIQIAIEVQDDAEQPDHKAILGLTLGPEPAGGFAFLWQARQRVAVVPVDDLGNFVIPDLAPGSYELILSGPEAEIHIQELQIGRV